MISPTSCRSLPVTPAQAKALARNVEVGSSQLKATGFYVAIPRRNVNPPVTSRKPLILIIDDDETVRHILGIYLEDDGYETRSAGNLDEILS